mgnify:CR=1 FL=1
MIYSCKNSPDSEKGGIERPKVMGGGGGAGGLSSSSPLGCFPCERVTPLP